MKIGTSAPFSYSKSTPSGVRLSLTLLGGIFMYYELFNEIFEKMKIKYVYLR